MAWETKCSAASAGMSACPRKCAGMTLVVTKSLTWPDFVIVSCSTAAASKFTEGLQDLVVVGDCNPQSQPLAGLFNLVQACTGLTADVLGSGHLHTTLLGCWAGASTIDLSVHTQALCNSPDTCTGMIGI